ncbi:MAG: hypothetical protein RR444_09465 [Oscillospiraceae bacterium]
MEYVREITDSNKLIPLFNLPKAMHNRRVEVIILPIDDIVKQGAKSLRGTLSRYAKPELQALESDAWSNEVKQKYETR